jgi:hypothetical protein
MTSLVEKLLSTNKQEIASAISDLRNADFVETAVVSFLKTFIAALSNQCPLSAREKRSRIDSVLRLLPLRPANLSAAIADMPPLYPTLRTMLASALPIELRQYVYPQSEKSPGSTSVINDEKATTKPPAIPPTSIEEVKGLPQVVVMSATERDSNLHLLRSNNFLPLSVATPSKLSEVLEGAWDICGFVADGSFWAQIPCAEQERVLAQIAGFSSFAWLRIDTTNLQVREQRIADIVRTATADPNTSGVDRLSLQSDANLKGSQLDWLVAANESLEDPDQCKIYPGELNAKETHLVQCAVRQGLHPRLSGGAQLKMSPIRASFLKEGRTSAKVAVISFDSGLEPMVLKVDSQDYIVDEATRFNRFIKPLDDNLNPRVFIHGTVGVLVFDLVNHPHNPRSPAPTAEKRIEHLWHSEVYPAGRDPSSETILNNMRLGLQSAIQKLGRLNRTAHSGTGIENYSKPSVRAIEDLEASGLSWGFHNDFILARNRAKGQFENLDGRAVVHGDVQLRNVLLRDDREAFFIDYASSGPGHPCIDLVRLELSLFYSAFRSLSGEEEIASLNRDLSVTSMTSTDLKSKYAHLLKVHTNMLWLDAAVMARDECLQVLAEFGGRRGDYVICKYLSAWSSLAISSVPSSLARSVIAGLGSHIK